jgi:hypothetical protein
MEHLVVAMAFKIRFQGQLLIMLVVVVVVLEVLLQAGLVVVGQAATAE